MHRNVHKPAYINKCLERREASSILGKPCEIVGFYVICSTGKELFALQP